MIVCSIPQDAKVLLGLLDLAFQSLHALLPTAGRLVRLLECRHLDHHLVGMSCKDQCCGIASLTRIHGSAQNVHLIREACHLRFGSPQLLDCFLLSCLAQPDLKSTNVALGNSQLIVRRSEGASDR